MKKEYEKPIIEVEKINVEDIITESGTKSFNKYGFLNSDADADWEFGN